MRRAPATNRPHAGSTANGYVTAEEWATNNTNPLLTASGAPPTRATPCARFHLNYKTRRVQITTPFAFKPNASPWTAFTVPPSE